MLEKSLELLPVENIGFCYTHLDQAARDRRSISDMRGVVEVIDNPAQTSTVVQSDNLPLQRAFADLDEFNRFLIRHLETLGIPFEQLWRKR